MLSDRHIVNTDVNFLASASYLIIQLLSRITNHKSPLELLYHQIPDYNFLKTFGYACWAHLSPYSSHKLDLQSKQCVFLGYSLHHKGYKCLDLSTNRVYISCNVVFDEKNFLLLLSQPLTTVTTLQICRLSHSFVFPQYCYKIISATSTCYLQFPIL